MSVEATNYVIGTHIPDAAAKLVAMVLADYADKASGRCWPKVETIARKCSQSVRTVQRKVQALIDLDVLHVWESPVGSRESNTYVLHLPGVIRPGEEGFAPAADARRRLRKRRLPPQDVSVPEPEDAVTCHLPGDTSGTSQVTLASPPKTPPAESPETESRPPNPPEDGGTRTHREATSGENTSESEADPGRTAPEEARREGRLGRASARHRAPALPPDAAQRYRELVAAYPADGVVGARQRDAQALFATLSAAEQRTAIAAARLVAEKHRRRPGHPLGLLTFLRQTDLSGGAPALGSAATPPDFVAARNAAGLEKALRGEWPSGCTCFVDADSAAGAAWEAHFARFGVRPRWMQLQTGVGAYLPAPFPPAREAA